ncbi:hypothetical protein NMY22_g11402 [Coprinellus aureogranulatus]|nr:hypothetical protein NMY22_g11402 [Coprinellus aureogranulatus]
MARFTGAINSKDSEVQRVESELSAMMHDLLRVQDELRVASEERGRLQEQARQKDRVEDELNQVKAELRLAFSRQEVHELALAAKDTALGTIKEELQSSKESLRSLQGELRRQGEELIKAQSELEQKGEEFLRLETALKDNIRRTQEQLNGALRELSHKEGMEAEQIKIKTEVMDALNKKTTEIGQVQGKYRASGEELSRTQARLRQAEQDLQKARQHLHQREGTEAEIRKVNTELKVSLSRRNMDVGKVEEKHRASAEAALRLQGQLQAREDELSKTKAVLASTEEYRRKAVVRVIALSMIIALICSKPPPVDVGVAIMVLAIPLANFPHVRQWFRYRFSS